MHMHAYAYVYMHAYLPICPPNPSSPPSCPLSAMGGDTATELESEIDRDQIGGDGESENGKIGRGITKLSNLDFGGMPPLP